MVPPELVKFCDKKPVLGTGFVRLVDVMGDDGAVVTAARVTTGKGRSAHVWSAEVDGCPGLAQLNATCKVCGVDAFDSGPCIEGDRRLIRYMMRGRHTSPFEFCEIVIHLRIPMDCWRQMVRHRTASVQEFSTRYSPAIDEMATTPPDAWRAQSGANRQGSSGMVEEWPKDYKIEGYALPGATGVLAPSGMGFHMDRDDPTPGDYLTAREQKLHEHAREVYEERLAFGVAREQARKDLPLSNFTEVYWKCDLHNLLHFLSLRLDEHAQLEIRQYAQAIADIVREWVPLTWEAFVDYRLEARTFSRMEVDLLKRMATYVEEHEGELAKGEGREYSLSAFWHALIENSTDKMEPVNQMNARERADFLAALGVESKS